MRHTTLDEIEALDRDDPLRRFRDEFDLPARLIYLDGNSLGALPRATAGRLAQTVAEQWGRDLISSWNKHGWIDAPGRIGNKLARLIGAGIDEVVVADSTSVNLFKVLSAACQISGKRSVILSEPENFPNDLYIAQGFQALSQHRWRLRLAATSQLEDSIDDQVAAVLLTHVHYKTAFKHDMARLTTRAHERGALVIWDLSHSAGAVDVRLNEVGADFAVGCGYKYLNGGPGSPAYLYVAKRHQSRVVSPIAGWLGHAHAFAFVDDYRPAPGIHRFLAGAHPILGMTALEVGVDLILQANIQAIVEKAQALCSLFIELVESRCGEFGLELATPRDTEQRGSHVALYHPNGYAIMQALIARGVIGDFRAPDVLRFGFAPLYVSYLDVWNAVEVLHEILSSRSWDRPEYRVVRHVT